MSTRISEDRIGGVARAFFVLPLIALAGCGPVDQQSARESQVNEQLPDPAAGTRIACAPAGAADFTHACTLERTGDTVIVRNPDGGFHRLLIADDGTVTAADGAEAARVGARTQDGIEAVIGGDRYHLPVPS